MACMRHQKEISNLLTDKGSCPWCYILQLEEKIDGLEIENGTLREIREEEKDDEG